MKMVEPSSASRGRSAGMPRWVKVSLTVGAILLLLVIVVVVFQIGGEHGPGRHLGLPMAPLTAAPLSSFLTGR
jgi:hypothetical protein